MERSLGLSRLDFRYDFLETLDRLRGLRIEPYVAVKVKAVEVGLVLDHHSASICLAYETVDFGMSRLPVYEDEGSLEGVFERLRRVGVGVLDAFLKLKHHGACGVDYLDAVAPGGLIGGWWFAMSAEQHLHVV